MAGYRNRQARARAAYIASNGVTPTPSPTPGPTPSPSPTPTPGLWNSGVNYLHVGNSFVAGLGSTGGHTLPVQIQAAAPIAGSGAKVNPAMGTSGITWDALNSNGSTYDAIFVEGKYNILVVGETTNSVITQGLTTAQAIASAKAFIAARKAARAWDKIVVYGTIPRQDTTEAGSISKNATMSAVDADMMANPASYGIDLFVDIRTGTAFDFTDYTDASFTTKTTYGDTAGTPRVHPNNAGVDIIQAKISAALQTIIAPAAKPEIIIVAPLTLNEGSGTTPFPNIVRRQGTTGALNVTWSYVAGTAVAADFVGGALPTGGTVTIPDGQTDATIINNIQGNTTAQGNRTFGVKIAIPTGYAAGPSIAATNTIVDDDTPSVPLGPNLTETVAATYAASPTGFGQARMAGYAASPGTTGADVMPNGSIWTAEARFKISAVPVNADYIMGINQRFGIGVSKTDGRLISFFRAPGGLVYINTTNDNGAGTNPVVTDGLWHHVAMVAASTGVYVYLDGILIGQDTTYRATTSAGTSAFNLGATANLASYEFGGSIDEVAIWSAVEKYSTNFTPPTAAYTGSEPGLTSLYHCDGNMNAAIKP